MGSGLVINKMHLRISFRVCRDALTIGSPLHDETSAWKMHSNRSVAKDCANIPSLTEYAQRSNRIIYCFETFLLF